MERNDTPRTLAEAIRYFSDEDVCLEYVKARRWQNGKAKCPTCGSEAVRITYKQLIGEAKDTPTMDLALA